MTLSAKVKNLFTSIRFIQLVVVAVLQVLVVMNIIDSVQGEALTQVIQALILGSVTIGTIDSAATKASSTNIAATNPQVEVKDSQIDVTTDQEDIDQLLGKL